DQCQHSFTAGAAVDAQAFQIVDLVAEVGLEQHRSVEHGASFDIGLGNAADADEKTAGPTELALEQQEIAGRQEGGVADVEIGDAIYRKGARTRAADQEAEDVAVLIEAALRD